MSTAQTLTPSTRKPRTTKAKTIISNDNLAVPAPVVPPVEQTQVETPVSPYTRAKTAKRDADGIETVSSLGLRRKIIEGDAKKMSIYISDGDYLHLCTLGMQMRVTWDEVLRGLISQCMASNDPKESLKHFIPLPC